MKHFKRYNASVFTEADFRGARDAWRADLCGAPGEHDRSDPDTRRLLDEREATSARRRAQMRRESDAVILFGDAPPTASADLRAQYDAILEMALPYATPGSPLEGDAALKADVLLALDWMNEHMYGANVLSDESYRSYKLFNWWEWYIGGARALIDTVMLLAEDLPRAEIERYLLPIDFIYTQMRTEPGAHHALSRILIGTPLSLLHENRALLQAMFADESLLLEPHADGYCMRPDWCLLTHGHPYNIGYGICHLYRTARVYGILKRSPLAFTCKDERNFLNMARYTFAACLYRGRALSLMSGRSMQEGEIPGAKRIVKGLRYLLGLLGEEADREVLEIIRRNLVGEVKSAMLSDLGTRPAALRALAMDEPPERDFSHMWHTGDCGVQFRRGRAFALRMSSSRIPNYESINGVNADAWYTADGMVYRYDGDDGQYDRDWWRDVDKYHMPGATADTQTREARFIGPDYEYMSGQDFVGGVGLDGAFLACAMDLESFHCERDLGAPDEGYGASQPLHACSLTAKKAWFFFDRAMAALGAEVCARDGFPVHTTVENRRLAAEDRFVLDGALVQTELEVEDARWAALPGAGYVFPSGGRVHASRSDGERPFARLWFDHGISPADGSYAYVTIPGAGERETARLAEEPDVTVLRNDGRVQAAREASSGLTGYAFRAADACGNLRAGAPCVAMTRETDAELSLSACDPTQKLDSFTLTLGGSLSPLSLDEGVSLTSENGVTTLTFRCKGALGKRFGARFKKEASR